MLATRTLRSRRPAARGAGRLLTHAMFAIALVLSVVFAHGGACAAVELSERVVHSAHPAGGGGSSAPHGVRCLHRDLPVGHVHGTEQDCSATNPTAAPISPAGPAVVLSCPAGARTAVAATAPTGIGRGAGPDRASLCLMRV
ncbi:hypothetical protein AB0H88_26250 [Nonomuraea sp. NPDC050680]|uniref:hypothetical protein n=1 Tax=Nonomuraea sp. NPDC050680 TaxID=3154630 RepID=UPI0033C60551